jgi:cytochrome c-type biogenesis protein CcmH
MMLSGKQDTPLPPAPALRAAADDLPLRGEGEWGARPAPSPLEGEGWGGRCIRAKAFRIIAFTFFLFCVAAPAFAVQPDEILKDPALEARARTLSRELRCMVCQNQSIDDSEAPLARDLRILVRQRLEAGDSDRQVLDFLVARYGDFVLLRPPLQRDTLLLWFLTPAALIAGAIGLFVMARRRKVATAEPVALSAEEQRKLSTLVRPSGPEH